MGTDLELKKRPLLNVFRIQSKGQDLEKLNVRN